MSGAARRRRRVAELARALARDPGAVAVRFERASLLREDGRFDEAKAEYLALLQQDPAHFGALNDFGTMVLAAGFTSAARSLFGEAVRQHPDNPAGHVNLANLLHLAGERDAARAHYETALRLDPTHLHAHRGMGNLLAGEGDVAGARRHRDLGFRDHALTTLPYRGDGPPIRVLLLVSAAGGNIPTTALLDPRQFATTVLVAEYHRPCRPLPAHDVIFNSIGDADLCAEGLAAAVAIVDRSARPVINHPRAVSVTGRLANAQRLHGLPGVRAPKMALLPRAALVADAAAVLSGAGFGFPCLVRAPGFHTGEHFERVAAPAALAAAVQTFPGDQAWVIEELDARGLDGKFRKMRAMMIDGRLYPLHLAVSARWKVHYFTADMSTSEAHRAEDAAYLARMADVVGTRGMAALERICQALALDYGGVDFAVDAQGEILLFEANATMVVYPPVTDPKWAYRVSAVEAVIAAVQAMLRARARAAPAAGAEASAS